ncbi:MAG: MEDS domain-containing protein [Anaerolineae bacterium]
MTYIRSPRTLADLGPGEHLCGLYESEEEHYTVLTAFIRQGLRRGDKVVYVAGHAAARAVLDHLRDDGLDVEHYLTCEQLAVHTHDDYVQKGVFDLETAVALLWAEVEHILAGSFSGLRVVHEMSWMQEQFGPDQVVAYEARLNELLPGSCCLALCQYDQRCLDSAVLLDALRAHPLTVIGTTVYDNFYYVSPVKTSAELRRWLDNLSHHQRTEEKCRAYREHLEELIREHAVQPHPRQRLGRAKLFPFQHPGALVWERVPEPGPLPAREESTISIPIETTWRQRNPELALLNRVGQALNASRDPDQILNTVLEVARRLLDVVVCLAWLNDPQTDELVCQYATGSRSEIVRGRRLAPGQGLAGWVAQNRESLIVSSQQEQARYLEKNDLGLHSVLSIPLQIKGDVIGVIQVLDAQIARFTSADLALVGALALSAAGAIENAWLYQEAETLRLCNEHIMQSVKHGLLKHTARASTIVNHSVPGRWATL